MKDINIYQAASNFARQYFEAKKSKKSGPNRRKKFGNTYSKILKLVQNKQTKKN